MFEVLQVQAVTLKGERVAVERTARGFPKESRIQITGAPKEITHFLEFVPLGFQLEAFVKKATRQEVVLRLQFLGRELEITVKNLLGLEFKPGQRVLLTLIDKNPYVLKLSLPLARSHEIFSKIRNFFQNPLSGLIARFQNLEQLSNLIANSGLFYEAKVVRYLLGKEKRENLKKDLKYQLHHIIKGFGFDKTKHILIALPIKGRFTKAKINLPFLRVDLLKFAQVYASFYELSPKAVETIGKFILLTKEKIKRRFPKVSKNFKKLELSHPLFFHPLEGEIYSTFKSRVVSFDLLKDLVEFIQFLQGWSIVQNYSKAIIPFTYKGRSFFLGLYSVGNRKNISLLWKNGLIRLSYLETNPWQGELLFVLKDENILRTFQKHIEELKKELKKLHFRVTDIKFNIATNLEELFILDMADKDHSNFLEIYL